MTRILLLLAVLTGTAVCMAQTDVTMRAYDNARTGWNPNEKVLTQAKVIKDGLRLIPQGALPLFGDARGSEGAPLIVHGVQTPKGKRDLILTANMANWVQAFDLHTGAEIWRLSLGRPVDGNRNIDMHLVNQHWGCLATGTVWKNVLYEDCQVSTDNSGTPASGRYFFFAIDYAKGTLVYKVSSQDDTRLWKKRGSLIASNLDGRDTVCDTHGSVYETADGLTGGMTCLDVAQRKVVLQWKNSAGHWNGGEGPVIKPNGDIFLMSGNGAFDPARGWYGESFLRGHYKYDGTGTASFTVDDDWSPWTDFQRSGQRDPNLDATAPAVARQATPAMDGMGKPSGENALSEEMRQPVNGAMAMPALQGARVESEVDPSGRISIRVYPDPVMAKGGNSDLDLGSGGYTYIAALDQLCGAGKEGLLYCLPAANMGHTTLQGVQNHRKNCEALVGGSPVYATAYVGNADPCTDDMNRLNFLPVNGNVPVTAHNHMTPVLMENPLNAGEQDLFLWGENFALHEWQLHPAAKPSFVAEGNEYASPDARGRAPGGMTGGMVTGCSNGKDPNSYLLIATVPYGDANAPPLPPGATPGRMLVYDPLHRGDDGNLRVLWDSARWGIAFSFNKFLPPVCTDGEVIYASYDGRVLILH